MGKVLGIYSSPPSKKPSISRQDACSPSHVMRRTVVICVTESISPCQQYQDIGPERSV
jgi:hypothetical protein